MKNYKTILAIDEKARLDSTSYVVNNIKSINVVEILSSYASVLNFLKDNKAEILIFDLNIEGMSDINNIPKIVTAAKGSGIIIITSKVTNYNMKFIIKAMTLGVNDFVIYPEQINSSTLSSFEAELLGKLSSVIDCIEKASDPSSAKLNLVKQDNVATKLKPLPEGSTTELGEVILLRTTKAEVPRAIAIASSTGGPKALSSIFSDLDDEGLNQPIFVTQHIPADFSSHLANQLSAVSSRPCLEAEDGMVVKPNHIYIAPGDFHMVFEKLNDKVIIRLLKTDPVNFCRPSADPMLKSLAEIYKSRLLVVVLTGMGKDGLDGAREVARNEGVVIAQDKLTSIIWGMPGAVARDGLCHAVLPLEQIPAYIQMIGAP